MRIWLMKTTMVFERLMLPVSLRSACDMRRACSPTCISPISPSISARGVRAATESTTTMSTAFERTSMSVISSACSPVSGCDTSSSLMFTPSLSAYEGSSACSASTNAAVPPPRCTSAMTCRVSVVLPEASGPRSEEHTSELQSQSNLVCRLLLEKKKNTAHTNEPVQPDPELDPVQNHQDAPIEAHPRVVRAPHPDDRTHSRHRDALHRYPLHQSH